MTGRVDRGGGAPRASDGVDGAEARRETASVEPEPMPMVTLPEASVATAVEPVEKVMVLPSTVRAGAVGAGVCRSSEEPPRCQPTGCWR